MAPHQTLVVEGLQQTEWGGFATPDGLVVFAPNEAYGHLWFEVGAFEEDGSKTHIADWTFGTFGGDFCSYAITADDSVSLTEEAVQADVWSVRMSNGTTPTHGNDGISTYLQVQAMVEDGRFPSGFDGFERVWAQIHDEDGRLLYQYPVPWSYQTRTGYYADQTLDVHEAVGPNQMSIDDARLHGVTIVVETNIGTWASNALNVDGT